MGRKSEAWFWEARDAWYTTLNGKRRLLAKGKDSRKEAERALHAILGQVENNQPVASQAGGHTVEWLAYRFLDKAKRTLDPLTTEFYRRHLKSFCDAHGNLEAETVAPYHVTNWIAASGWGATTAAGAVGAVKRLYRWSKKIGYLTSNPLIETEKPRAKVRESILTPEQFSVILAEAKDQPWRDFLIAIHETGCRPREAASVTAAQVDLKIGTWTVRNKTRHKGSPTRTIYLTPAVVELSRRLVKANPKGPIFRNSRGNAWSRYAIGGRFRTIRKRHGWGPETVAYSVRHLYATDALEQGVPIATVAELMGHTDTAMISKVYSKLKNRSDHLRAAASQVRPTQTAQSGQSPEQDVPPSVSEAREPGTSKS